LEHFEKSVGMFSEIQLETDGILTDYSKIIDLGALRNK